MEKDKNRYSSHIVLAVLAVIFAFVIYWNQGSQYIGYIKTISRYYRIDHQRKALEKKYKEAETQFYRGTASYEKGNYPAAINELGRSIELDPEVAEAYSNRGLAYLENKDLQHALADFTKAIELKPADPFNYGWRAEVYRRKGDTDNAENDQRTYLRLCVQQRVPLSDLEVTASVPPTAAPGEKILCSVTVRNKGNSGSGPMQVKLCPPVQMRFISGDGSPQYSQAGDDNWVDFPAPEHAPEFIEWSIGNIEAGESCTYNAVLRIKDSAEPGAALTGELYFGQRELDGEDGARLQPAEYYTGTRRTFSITIGRSAGGIGLTMPAPTSIDITKEKEVAGYCEPFQLDAYLVNAEGNGIPAQKVMFSLQGNKYREVETGDKGYFYCVIAIDEKRLPGDYTISIDYPGDGVLLKPAHKTVQLKVIKAKLHVFTPAWVTISNEDKLKMTLGITQTGSVRVFSADGGRKKFSLMGRNNDAWQFLGKAELAGNKLVFELPLTTNLMECLKKDNSLGLSYEGDNCYEPLNEEHLTVKFEQVIGHNGER